MSKLIKVLFKELNVVVSMLYYMIYESITRDDYEEDFAYALNDDFDESNFINYLAKLKYILEIIMNILAVDSINSSSFNCLIDQLNDSEDIELKKLYSGAYLKEFLVELTNLENKTKAIEMIVLSMACQNTDECVKEWRYIVAKIYLLIYELILFLNIDNDIFEDVYEIAKYDLKNKYFDLNTYKLITWTKVEDIFDDKDEQ